MRTPGRAIRGVWPPALRPSGPSEARRPGSRAAARQGPLPRQLNPNDRTCPSTRARRPEAALRRARDRHGSEGPHQERGTEAASRPRRALGTAPRRAGRPPRLGPRRNRPRRNLPRMGSSPCRGSAPKKARLQDRTRQLKHEEAKRPQGRATEGSGPAGAAASTTMAAIATTAAPRVDHPANRPKAPAPRHRAPRASRPPQGLPAPRAGRPPRVRPAPRAPQARALLAPRARQPLRAAARQACPAPRTPRHPPRPALAHQHRLAHLPRGS